jgi:hypothetical protein
MTDEGSVGTRAHPGSVIPAQAGIQGARMEDLPLRGKVFKSPCMFHP